MSLSYARLYDAYDAVQTERRAAILQRQRPRNPLQAYLAQNGGACGKKDGFARMQDCRRALEALDGLGWQRSFHQRLFHDNFIRSCTRVFFKTEPAGAFARAHQAVLDLNGWDTLAQEILISTPRRFGKTISVSMFAAALLFSAKSVELSIYSTCKRISQKLLRNVQKFLRLVFEGTDTPPFKEIRSNMEELVLQGPEGPTDVRTVNSYPSKVGRARVVCARVVRARGGAGRSQAHASWKCRTPTVLCSKSLESFPARAKRSASSCSASSCSAARAPVLHFKSDLRSWPYSRTSREKVARGMLWTGREREFFFAMRSRALCARPRPRALPRFFFRGRPVPLSGQAHVVRVHRPVALGAHVEGVLRGDAGARLDVGVLERARGELRDAHLVGGEAQVAEGGHAGLRRALPGDADAEGEGGAEELAEGVGDHAVPVRVLGLQRVEARGQLAADDDRHGGVVRVVEGPGALGQAPRGIGGQRRGQGVGGRAGLPEGGEHAHPVGGRAVHLGQLLDEQRVHLVALLRRVAEQLLADLHGHRGGARQAHEGGPEEGAQARLVGLGRVGVDRDAAERALAGVVRGHVEDVLVEGALGGVGAVVGGEVGEDGLVGADADDLVHELRGHGQGVGEGHAHLGAVLAVQGELRGVARRRRRVGAEVGGALDGHVAPHAVGAADRGEQGAVPREVGAGLRGGLGVGGALGGADGEVVVPLLGVQHAPEADERARHPRVVLRPQRGEEGAGVRLLRHARGEPLGEAGVQGAQPLGVGGRAGREQRVVALVQALGRLDDALGAVLAVVGDGREADPLAQGGGGPARLQGAAQLEDAAAHRGRRAAGQGRREGARVGEALRVEGHAAEGAGNVLGLAQLDHLPREAGGVVGVVDGREGAADVRVDAGQPEAHDEIRLRQGGQRVGPEPRGLRGLVRVVHDPAQVDGGGEGGHEVAQDGVVGQAALHVPVGEGVHELHPRVERADGEVREGLLDGLAHRDDGAPRAVQLVQRGGAQAQAARRREAGREVAEAQEHRVLGVVVAHAQAAVPAAEVRAAAAGLQQPEQAVHGDEVGGERAVAGALGRRDVEGHGELDGVHVRDPGRAGRQAQPLLPRRRGAALQAQAHAGGAVGGDRGQAEGVAAAAHPGRQEVARDLAGLGLRALRQRRPERGRDDAASDDDVHLGSEGHLGHPAHARVPRAFIGRRLGRGARLRRCAICGRGVRLPPADLPPAQSWPRRAFATRPFAAHPMGI